MCVCLCVCVCVCFMGLTLISLFNKFTTHSSISCFNSWIGQCPQTLHNLNLFFDLRIPPNGVPMLRFISLTWTNWACPLLFILRLCLFLLSWLFRLFYSIKSHDDYPLLTLFFCSCSWLVDPFNHVYLFMSLPKWSQRPSMFDACCDPCRRRKGSWRLW